jgi:hypothetical protein
VQGRATDLQVGMFSVVFGDSALSCSYLSAGRNERQFVNSDNKAPSLSQKEKTMCPHFPTMISDHFKLVKKLGKVINSTGNHKMADISP